MKNFIILTEAIEYIEGNLCEPITREEVARQCHVSLSMLEKLFGYALGINIRAYIVKRRITQAARDLAVSGIRVTDAAMKYQFHSPEVFSRAFARVWNICPSAFASKWKFTGIFPKINYTYQEGEDLYMARKRVDISDAYDYLRAHKGSYVLCFDAQHLSAFNSISKKAGDLAILEMAARIDRYAGDQMQVLRIGGDEFALITGLDDAQQAEELAQRVLEQNGMPITFEGKELPLSLWCGITQVPQALRYSDFFTELHDTITKSKE